MRKKFSVKLQVTAWLTALMLALALALLIFLLFISKTVSLQTSMSQLSQTLQGNVGYVDVSSGSWELEDGFLFSHSGVSTLLYSKNESWLAGQLPVSFTADVPFENGLMRTVDISDVQYLVLDIWIPIGWEDGIWLRGLLEVPKYPQAVRNLLVLAFASLPVFLLLAALGSYGIAKKAFRPLEDIIGTAEAVNEARDLSKRIGLPEGRDEFFRLAAAFDRLFERLERSFEAEKQFTADASHELRTPVSVVKGACEYAEKYDETPEEWRESVAMIHRQAVKMSDMIAQLLCMTRLEQGTEMLVMERLDFGQLVRTVCWEWTGRDAASDRAVEDAVSVGGRGREREDAVSADGRGREREDAVFADGRGRERDDAVFADGRGREREDAVSVDRCGSTAKERELILEIAENVFVEGNPEMLSRLVRNLVENAFKYSKEDGQVRVLLCKNGNEALLSVRDSGIGIPAEEQDKIWQRFYRTDEARDQNMGVGLGLPMVRQIAEIHGGSMSLESRPGEGSTFTFHIHCKNGNGIQHP